MNNLEMLGKYRIVGELGRGAMGIVYEAFDTLIERTVAIKTILKSTINVNDAEDIFSRFRREARAAGRLTHPKIISIYEYGENEELAYIVMELVRGKELSEYFDHGKRLSISEGLHIVMQLLDALDYLHAHGVVHRDIKPANIMITSAGDIKIADFGIAKIDASGHTQVGVVLGTPTYMAPEQFMGYEVDHRADLYAAGVLLYLILTGERPFIGSVIAIMHQAVHREASPPSGLNPLVTKQLDAVVKTAMAKRPEERFQSAKQFLKALKLAAQSLQIGENPGANIVMLPTIEVPTFDETLELPSRVNSTGAWREADIAAWQRITSSQNPADFKLYLHEYPDGGFAELANLRIQTLEKSAAIAAEQVERAKQEALARAVLEEKNKAAEQEALKKSRDEARARAQAQAQLKADEQLKAQLAQKIALIKNEAEEARANEVLKREKEAQEQRQRAKELSDTLATHAKKIATVVAERVTESEAERRLKIETRRKLEEEVQRKKQARKQVLEEREAAEKRAVAEAEMKRQRAAAELAERDREIEAAKAQAQAADKLRREAEARALLEQKRSRKKMLFIGIFLVLLLIFMVLGLLH
jgi:serine/threonine-protein kinase